MKRLEKLFPPGYPKIEQNIISMIVLEVVTLLWATILYTNRYNLDMWEVKNNFAEKLMPFNLYSRGVCSPYLIVLVFCIIWAISLRGYFTRRSRSDYLMQRLPNGGEMTRRWLAAPLIMAVLGLVLFVIALLLMHLSFVKGTPPKYLPEPEAIDFINAFMPNFTHWGGLSGGH
jgi:steroid 5-alpha reductase family enzyme